MTRRIYKYDPKTKEMYEVIGHPRSRGVSAKDVGLLQNDRIYSEKPFVAHDGTVINSRRKHREYMKRHSLTTADDFTKHWQESAKLRADAHTENRQQKNERIEAIKHAIEVNRHGKRR